MCNDLLFITSKSSRASKICTVKARQIRCNFQKILLFAEENEKKIPITSIEIRINENIFYHSNGYIILNDMKNKYNVGNYIYEIPFNVGAEEREVGHGN